MKKFILFTTLLFCNFIIAQHLQYDEIDKFTNNREVFITATKSENWRNSDAITKNIFKGNLFLSVRLTKTEENKIYSFINLNIQSPTILCFGDDEIIILFEDGDKVTLKQASKIDCGTNIDIKYILTKEATSILKNKAAKEMRVYTRDGYIDYEIKSKATNIIQKTFELAEIKLNELE